MDALATAEEYCKCFPYMDTAALVFLLADGWEQLCVRNDYLKSKTIKKIVLLVADSKTEPEVMEVRDEGWARGAKDEGGARGAKDEGGARGVKDEGRELFA